MALTYRNVLKNHLVEVPEPADIIAAAEQEAERLFRKGTKRDRLDGELVTDRARAQAQAQRQTLAKMDQSRRWERVSTPPVAAVRDSGLGRAPAPPETAAESVAEPVAKPAKTTTAAKKDAEA